MFWIGVHSAQLQHNSTRYVGWEVNHGKIAIQTLMLTRQYTNIPCRNVFEILCTVHLRPEKVSLKLERRRGFEKHMSASNAGDWNGV